MTVERDARATSPEANSMRGLVRRMIVSRVAPVIWQLLGLKLPKQRGESVEAEVFHGVGICALPAEDGKPEAIVINVGGASAPVIIATRDEQTRSAVVPNGMKAGETCIYSEGAIVYLRDGTVEVRTPSGSAKRLLTVDDGAALKQAIASAATAPADGGAVFKTNIATNLLNWPTGTTVLKGE